MVNADKNPKFFLAVDFYCGAGGTTRGLLDAGGYVIAGIDKDLGCHDTYVMNNPNETLDGDDPAFLAFDMFPFSDDYPQGQQHEVWQKLERLIPMYRDKAPGVPLVFAICAPCQSFTKFVQRHMTSDQHQYVNHESEETHEGYILSKNTQHSGASALYDDGHQRR